MGMGSAARTSPAGGGERRKTHQKLQLEGKKEKGKSVRYGGETQTEGDKRRKGELGRRKNGDSSKREAKKTKGDSKGGNGKVKTKAPVPGIRVAMTGEKKEIVKQKKSKKKMGNGFNREEKTNKRKGKDQSSNLDGGFEEKMKEASIKELLVEKWGKVVPKGH